MNVLVINCGSSTLKFDLIRLEIEDNSISHESFVARGTVDKIGENANISFKTEDSEGVSENASIADHAEAVQQALTKLKSSGLLRESGLDAIGHRVVHGGVRFVRPTTIDEAVIDGIEMVSEFAPLHNGPALAAIRAAHDALGQSVPMVAVFDTAFHRTLPEIASRYAIPRELSDKHHIWRYGFHGIAHRYMAERYSIIASRPLDQISLITLQLGNGCSAAAIQGGRSVDTSMGLTPLEGLVMGTRSGDVDPSLASFLAQREGVDIDEVEDWLNRRSGLLGVSGHSNDMRRLLEAEKLGDTNSSLAVDMFCYRIRKYIGSYMAAIGGADAVVFGGGIGENAPEIRERICEGMDWCGLKLDEERNYQAGGAEALISDDGAKVKVCVIPVNEAAIIARDTFECLRQN